MPSQRRDLLPMTVYVPPSVKAEVEARAADLSVPAGTLLRQIVMGNQPPAKGLK